jgi:hypothetical protein
MAIEYVYFGILGGSRTPDNPSGVIRSWNRSDGRRQAEVFTRNLKWEMSDVFSPSARPDYKTIVEIDESVVEQFIERVTRRITTERDG